MFHMGWFLSFNAAGWNTPWNGIAGSEWTKAEPWIDMARSLERAGFDYMMMEDGSFIPDVHRGSMQQSLASGNLPKLDPMALMGVLGQETAHLGLIATVTSTFYPPYLAARLISTLDHLTNGRTGANVVTSHNQRTAQNYGLDEQPEHDLRYEMADEWLTVVKALWNSWEPGALVMDEETGLFADHTKVHSIDFKGKWFSSRGPLNSIPSPQQSPVICQAGGSPAGRNLAAKHADTIVASVASVEQMREYRADMDVRLAHAGRKRSDCKILFVASPVLADTQREAQDRYERMLGTEEQRIERALVGLSFASGVDFAAFDLDAPVPAMSTNAAQQPLQRRLGADAATKTLREIASGPRQEINLVGTPASVAIQMGEMMDEVGGDGFLISGQLTRRLIGEITEGLAPELRKRDLIRSAYSHEHLRDNLLAF
ncbi:MAG: dibenzothiophene desulfurization enzyme [Pseudonocardiales bacterium]|nr:dibenzothiophene desulfurization enzyme [Pseudonocardiales bacterium]